MAIMWIVSFTLLAYSPAKRFSGATRLGLSMPVAEPAHGESSKWSNYVDGSVDGVGDSRLISEAVNPEIFQPSTWFIARSADTKPSAAVKTQPSRPSRLGVLDSALDALHTDAAFSAPVAHNSLTSVNRPSSVAGPAIAKPFRYPDESPGTVPRVSYRTGTENSPPSIQRHARSVSRAAPTEGSAPRSTSLTSGVAPERDRLLQTLSFISDRVLPRTTDLNTSTHTAINAQTTSQHLSQLPVRRGAHGFVFVSTVIPELPLRTDASSSGQSGLHAPSALWTTPGATNMRTVSSTAGRTAAPRSAMRIDTTKVYVLVGVVLGLVVVAVIVALVIKKYISRWTCLR